MALPATSIVHTAHGLWRAHPCVFFFQASFPSETGQLHLLGLSVQLLDFSSAKQRSAPPPPTCSLVMPWPGGLGRPTLRTPFPALCLLGSRGEKSVVVSPLPPPAQWPAGERRNSRRGPVGMGKASWSWVGLGSISGGATTCLIHC